MMERMSKETLSQRTSGQIRWLLFRRDMSASEMARRAGLTQSYVSRRLTGVAPFTLEDIERIAVALEVDVDTLMKIHSDQPDGGGAPVTIHFPTPADRTAGHTAERLIAGLPCTHRANTDDEPHHAHGGGLEVSPRTPAATRASARRRPTIQRHTHAGVTR